MPKRFKHNLSHYYLTSFDQGKVVPIAVQEVLPGDSFRHSVSALLRVTPLVTPVMHPVDVQVMTYFCPNRILWNEKIGDADNWEDFITQNDDTAALPTLSLAGTGEDLIDRMGVPSTSGLTINALPVRAYNMIYNEFFRDEQLVSEVDLEQKTLLSAMWQKDYFTTARPNPQQGADAEVVTFSQGVVPIDNLFTGDAGSDATRRGINADGTVTSLTASTPYSTLYVERDTQSAGDDVTNVPSVDLAGATAGLDINDLWASESLQRWRIHRNRFGDRYSDLLRAWSINPSDARLGRPEYLGGGKTVISFSEVLSTSDTSGSSGKDLGALAGHGIAALRTPAYKRFFNEHGYIISLMVVRPKPIYIDAVHRSWLRSAYSDFWAPEFELQGEQEITNAEIYATGGDDSTVFGYVLRHQDYRRTPNYVSGSFRSTDNDWHMARDFSSAPTLNASFVTADPTDRIYADTADAEIKAMVNHSLVARRLVSQRAKLS